MTPERLAPLVAGDAVLIIGLGRSGLATAEVLRGKQVAVTGYDDRPYPELASRVRLEQLGVTLAARSRLSAAAAKAKAAIISPGVALTNPAVRDVVAAGVPLISEIELAYQLSPAPLIAITGSKGKSTTTALIGHILRQAGKTVRVGGNIGNPLIHETAAALAGEWIVAEVSSFQLEATRTFAPRISVLLNLSADHLDRYASLHAYAKAKYRIFANQNEADVFIGNADDPNCAALRGERLRPQCLWFGSDAQAELSTPQAAGGNPEAASSEQHPAPLDAMLSNGRLWVRVKQALVPLIDAKALPLQGRHNALNALAAALASLAAGADIQAVREGLVSFRALPHRLSIVRQAGGVTWVDDSKATNPDAAIKALQAFAAPVILIAGGKSKKTDFSQFAAVAEEHAKLILLIGEAANEIAAHVHRVPVRFPGTLEEAVLTARQAAAAGDVVLLSPACASFDMFESAEQRGAIFAELARSLVAAGGLAAL